jgi:prepilin-type N-terminal cleavage/methylation domain-containing protein
MIEEVMKRQGFTLIELIATMVIAGILAAIAIPGFSRWLPNYRLRGAARDVYSNLQLAKMEAIKIRGECAVEFHPDDGSYKVVSGGADRIYSTLGDNVEIKTVTLSAYKSGVGYGHGEATEKATIGGGTIGDDISFNGDTVVFNSRGMINSNAGGYVYIENERDASFAIGVWTTGLVVLRKWQNGAWVQ